MMEWLREARVKQFLWILWLCPVVAAVTCPTVQAKDEATLIHIEQMWARALEQHDTATLACVLADEFEDADTDGRVTDRRATLEKAATARAVHHELSDLHAHVHGDFAYIRGLAEAI